MLLSVSGKALNRIILETESCSGQKAEGSSSWLSKERSCIDQNATLRIIIEQSLEWNSSLQYNLY